MTRPQTNRKMRYIKRTLSRSLDSFVGKPFNEEELRERFIAEQQRLIDKYYKTNTIVIEFQLKPEEGSENDNAGEN